ncbi:MAG: Flavin-dependent thymidylate synthase [Chlamydiales bacterium]|nr:Flavin-dependent thymidylate synthase [Chlamydiales bacterium]MCH9619564.1 Flavin-dependent thymidylate synthase [Chlamydiales bacterium]MCH9623170.1 Flavin-dependent thymidylate synthase [Chlamydiales bacterium]
MEKYEEFSDEQIKILERFVTNTSGNIFVLRNLPEVIKGALFSRYSRSSLGLRSLLLKEFILGEETAFESIVGEKEKTEDQMVAIKRAQNFYDRILDGYGDDSIGELGGAHLAIENISMLGAKVLEDSRIGGSPLEKSTRYIYFDQKVGGRYLYYREPILMTSAYRDAYTETCDHLFETYSALIPPMTELLEKQFPKESSMSKGAYNAALRAKVLDCLRGLLPAGTLTNMGIFGNGRFWESLCHKLQCQNLAEMQEVGKESFAELYKVMPSFVRRAESNHHHHENFNQFYASMSEQLDNITTHASLPKEESKGGVRLLYTDPDAEYKVAAALLFAQGTHSLSDLEAYCRTLPKEELAKIFDAGSSMRENRRHKSPRALEHAQFTFEIIGDFGVYRDLHRHRMLTQERQLLGTDCGYFIPPEVIDTPMEKEYRNAMEMAKKVHQSIAQELPEEAQYIVPMAYNIRWYFHINLRALQWLCELRSSPAGHPNYRHIAQEMARQTIEAVPSFENFFKFVNYEGYELGRLDQEERKIQKQSQR